MALTISWLPQAECTRDNVFDYIEHNWGIDVAVEFIVRLDNMVHQIAQGNVQFKRYEPGDCFCVPITKQNTMYYDVVGNRLDILTIWDSRQDPTKLNQTL